MRIALIVALLVAAAGVHKARVWLIRSWFGPGALRLAQATAPAPPARAAGPVRVLLVDGLTAELADRLPAHRRLCAEGVRLELEVGFPSVSLPVQHVLWTGAWQAESGIAFAVARLPSLRLPSLPGLLGRRSANAVAVAESHREVVASFPFTKIVAPPEGARSLSPLALQQQGLAEAQSSAALVLIHTLAVDEAGHRAGSRSLRYAEAARRSDELLAGLMAVRRPDWTLLALSDHGHLAAGGHGDIEEEVRRPRACLAGPGIPAGRSLAASVPDLTAVLAERLGLARPAGCRGQGLAALLEGAAPLAPPPAGPRLVEVVLALLALAVLPALALAYRRELRRARALLLLLPWSTGLAALLLSCFGPPSLSRAFVYPATSPVLLAVGLASGLLLALQLRTATSLRVPERAALVLLGAGCAAPALAAVLLGGWPIRQPALVAYWSGWASSLLEVAAVQLVALAASLAIAAAQRRLVSRSMVTSE